MAGLVTAVPSGIEPSCPKYDDMGVTKFVRGDMLTSVSACRYPMIVRNQTHHRTNLNLCDLDTVK